MLQIASPLWLLALPLPWIIWLASAYFTKNHTTTPAGAAIIHPHAGLLSRLATSPETTKRPWLWLSSCMLLIIALSRPQWLHNDSKGQGRDFMLAVDLSGSMRALDYSADNIEISRLEMLKRAVSEFLDNRHGDRAGLIVFADDAFTMAPITSDLGLIKTLVQQLRNGIAGEKTALGTAIMLAVKRLQDHKHPSRTLILFTDGSNTAGTIQAIDAALLAKKHNIRIYTVGIGSHGEVPFPRGPVEPQEMAKLPPDEATLKAIAAATGGHYYHAANIQEMQNIIDTIERLETLPVDQNPLIKRYELYTFPLMAAMVLLLVLWVRS